EHHARAAGLHQRGGLIERVEEAGAGGVDVDRAGRARADAARHLGRQPGREPVRGDGRDDHVVDVLAAAAGVGQRGFAGIDSEVGQRLAAVEPVALADAGPADDPLVARLEARREVVVAEAVRGQRGADAEQAGLQIHETTALRAAVPSTASVRFTMPVRTAPGPSSTKRSTPWARSASSVSRQRTGLSRFWASSRRTSANGAAEPLDQTGKAGWRTGVAASAARSRSAAATGVPVPSFSWSESCASQAHAQTRKIAGC